MSWIVPVGKQLGKARPDRAVSRQSQAAHLPSTFGPRDTGEASQTDCETRGSGIPGILYSELFCRDSGDMR